MQLIECEVSADTGGNEPVRDHLEAVADQGRQT